MIRFNKKVFCVFIIIFMFIMGPLIHFTENFWLQFRHECIFLKQTGFYCPGCGGTRAVLSLARGNVVSAFLYNSGVVVLALTVLLFAIEGITNKKILPRATAFWVVLVVLLLIYYVLRNLL